MTEDCFMHQLTRLKTRFGPKAFDNEFSRLLAAEMSQLHDEDFIDIVNRMLSMRPHTKPPVMVDFREARLAKEKLRFTRVVDGAAQAMNISGDKGPVFQARWPGAKTAMEAVEIEIMNRRIRKANDDAL